MSAMKHTPKPRKKLSNRPLGFLKGEVWMAPDFNAPLPTEILEGFGVEPEPDSTPKEARAREAATKQ